MQLTSLQQSEQRSAFKGFLPFFWLALVCLAGVLMADVLALSTWIWAAGFFICILIWLLILVLPRSFSITHLLKIWTHADNRLPGILLGVIFFLGGWRYAATRPILTPAHAAFYNDRGTVVMVGRVTKPPDHRDSHTNLTVQVQSLTPLFAHPNGFESENISGLVLLQVPSGGDWSFNDQLQVTGQLQTPFEDVDFSYRDYLARKGILSVMPYARVDWVKPGGGAGTLRTVIYNLRAQAYETLQTLFPSPESDLLAGILLGLDQGLSQNLQDAFSRTGTTHIIAISGFNIAILAGLFSGIFTRILGRKWGTLTAIAAITCYTILVGGDAAVVRAAIMGGLGVLGGMFGRRQNGLNSLGLAALAMTFIEPDIPWDIGFQLSVAATLGLVLYAQPLEEKFIKYATRWVSEEQAQKFVGPVSEFLLFTIAAQVMTLPIMAYHFGGVSWLALIANPLILPPQSMVMILGGLALLAGLLLIGLGQIVAVFALPFVSYTIRMVGLLARLPGGEWTLPNFNVLWLLLFYVLLFVFTFLPREQRADLGRRIFSHQAGLLILSGLVIFVWNRALTLPDTNLHLTLLDSDGTLLLQTPGGNALLIGGGPSPSALNQALGEMLPAGQRRLDAVIVGSTARDDLNGLLGAIQKYTPDRVLWGVDPYANQTSGRVHKLATDIDAAISPMEAGQRLDLGQGSAIHILWVGERGAVLWLEWENFSALLPTGKVDDQWLEVPQVPDVLLLKDGLSAQELPLWKINLWSPTVILLPLAEAEMPLYGEHPLVSLLDGYPLVTTLDHKWIRISTDGERLWVRGN